MDITVAQMAEKVQGALLSGDGHLLLRGVAGLRDAVEGDLSFLANRKYTGMVAETKATAVLVSEDWAGSAPCALIRVKNPDKAFTIAAQLLGPPPVQWPRGVHATAVVAGDVKLGRDVSIGPCSVLEAGVTIGDNTIIGAGSYIGHGSCIGSDCLVYPLVVVRERVRVGNRVILHSGAVLGSDGFGYYREGEAWKKIPQTGTVELGDDVEIGANVTVDRARFGTTVIEKGAKLDNLVQIAHNVRIGENSVMAAQVGISGSTTVGRNVQLGGQAGVAGHLTVGDHSVVGAQAGVTKDVDPATFVMGFPAMPHDKFKKMHAYTMRIPDLRERVAELEKKILELEKKLGDKG